VDQLTARGQASPDCSFYIREPFNRTKIKNTHDSNPSWGSLRLVRENMGELVARY